MKTTIKFIMMFTLFVLSFSMRGNTSDLIVGNELTFHSCQISEFSSAHHTLISTSGDLSSDTLQALSISDVELGAKLLGERNSSPNSLRLRRILESSSFLKDVISNLSLRERTVVIDRSKSFLSDMESRYGQSSCDYYIFALRRILV